MIKIQNPPEEAPRAEEVLDELIAHIPETDFNGHAEMKKGQRLKNSHYYVIAVETILGTFQGRNLGLCVYDGSVYLYNGSHWQQVEDGAVRDFLGSGAERMGIDKFDARFHAYKEQLYRQFLSSARQRKQSRPKGTVLVNLANGTFEITAKGTRLREYRPEDFLTYRLPFRYDSDAQAPLFRQYLDQVLPDREKQAVVAEYLGYVFVEQSVLKLEKVLLLYGTGANGKSVLFDIVNELLGPGNVCSFSLQSLTDNSGYSRANLEDKLLNYASELSTRMDPNIFKQLVSGEPIEVRRPYREPAILHNYAKLLFNCNERPKDIEHTDAFFRRLLIIEFDRTIPEEEQDKQLAGKIIRGELAGVFNWVLQGLGRLMKNGRFSECGASVAQVALYKKESDSVQMFIEENGYAPSAEKCMALKDVYPGYRAFCQEDGYRSLNCSNFRRRLEAAGVAVVRRSSGWVVYLEMQKETA